MPTRSTTYAYLDHNALTQSPSLTANHDKCSDPFTTPPSSPQSHLPSSTDSDAGIETPLAACIFGMQRPFFLATSILIPLACPGTVASICIITFHQRGDNIITRQAVVPTHFYLFPKHNQHSNYPFTASQLLHSVSARCAPCAPAQRLRPPQSLRYCPSWRVYF